MLKHEFMSLLRFSCKEIFMIKFCWRIIALFLVFTFSGCGSSSTEPSGLLPEISTFLGSHPNFGNAIDVEMISDWDKGPRQRVIFDSGKNLLFYAKDGQVVTVYEDGPNGRQKVWGQYDSTP